MAGKRDSQGVGSVWFGAGVNGAVKFIRFFNAEAATGIAIGGAACHSVAQVQAYANSILQPVTANLNYFAGVAAAAHAAQDWEDYAVWGMFSTRVANGTAALAQLIAQNGADDLVTGAATVGTSATCIVANASGAVARRDCWIEGLYRLKQPA